MIDFNQKDISYIDAYRAYKDGIKFIDDFDLKKRIDFSNRLISCFLKHGETLGDTRNFDQLRY